MQRHQLGLIWGAFVTAGGAINIYTFLGFLIFVMGLVVSYRSAVAMGMTSATEQIMAWKDQFGAKRTKRAEPDESQVPEKQAT